MTLIIFEKAKIYKNIEKRDHHVINVNKNREAEKQMDVQWTDSYGRNPKPIPVTRRSRRSKPRIQGPEPREAPDTEVGQEDNLTSQDKCLF